jgi:hypothetical protein
MLQRRYCAVDNFCRPPFSAPIGSFDSSRGDPISVSQGGNHGLFKFLQCERSAHPRRRGWAFSA